MWRANAHGTHLLTPLSYISVITALFTEVVKDRSGSKEENYSLVLSLYIVFLRVDRGHPCPADMEKDTSLCVVFEACNV